MVICCVIFVGVCWTSCCPGQRPDVGCMCVEPGTQNTFWNYELRIDGSVQSVAIDLFKGLNWRVHQCYATTYVLIHNVVVSLVFRVWTRETSGLCGMACGIYICHWRLKACSALTCIAAVGSLDVE